MRYLQKLLDKPAVYLIYLPERSKNVSVDIFVGTGRLHEKDAQVGIGHLLDHYINGSLYSRYLDRLTTNAWVGQENLHFHLSTTTPDALKDARRFLNGVFRPEFSNEELFRFERQSIINEMRTDYASAQIRQAQLVAQCRFVPGAPYGRPTYGEADSVGGIELPDLAEHHQRYFTGENTTIFIAAYKPDRAVMKDLFHLLKDYVLPSGSKPPYPAHPYSAFKITTNPESDIAGQQYVSLSFPGLSYEHSVEERIALNLFCRTFTGLSRHSVFHALRKAGIYAVDYHNIYYCHFGLVSFWATIPPARLEQFVEVLSQKLVECKTELISESFLNTRLKGVRERTRNAWKNNSDLYNWLMEYILDEGEVRTPKEVFASLKKITPEFMRSQAQKIFVRDRANLVVSGEVGQIDCPKIEAALLF